MNTFAKPVLALVALIAIGLLGVGLYLQLVQEMLPCPLCILQRYAFALTALVCLITVALPNQYLRAGAALASLAAITGAGIAIRHLWVKAHPTISCGIDVLEVFLNKIVFANWLPTLFEADGLCATEYDPILGLSIPAWALIWFTIFAVSLSLLALRYRRPA
jgi:disulfide bond formation protein DsbB